MKVFASFGSCSVQGAWRASQRKVREGRAAARAAGGAARARAGAAGARRPGTGWARSRGRGRRPAAARGGTRAGSPRARGHVLDHGVAEHEVEGAGRGRAGAPAVALHEGGVARCPSRAASRVPEPRKRASRSRPTAKADSSASESAVPPPPQPASSTRPCALTPARSSACEHLGAAQVLEHRVVVLAAEARRPRPRAMAGLVDGPHARQRLLRRARGSGRPRRRARKRSAMHARGGRGRARRGAARRASTARASAGGVLASAPPPRRRRRSPRSSSAARVVGGDDRRAAGQRLQGHRGRGLQHGREHEQVGRALQARRPPSLGTRPRKRTAPPRPSARRLRLERRLHLARARDQQHGVRPLARGPRANASQQRAPGRPAGAGASR